MSGRRSKKNQRLGSSRRGPKGLNRNIDKADDDDDDGFQQIAESGDGKNEFHTTSDYHSAQFDHPPSSTIDQQTSALECPAHARSHKDSLMETELPEGKRKMGSTRKSAGGFKVERKLHELRTTEELDEYVIQPNISATEEQHSSLKGDEQSRSSSFPSNLSLHTESSGLGGEHRTTVMDVVSENEEKDAIHHQEITSHSYEIVSATVSESDLLREDPVMFNKLKPLSRQETLLASTTGQKRRMGSTRRPLRGKNSENVGVQEHSRSMTENERKAEVIDEAKFSMSEEMAQMWDDVVRDDPSSHTETSLVSNQSLLAERAELTEPVVSAGTETINQSVTFPLVNPEKPLPETSSHNGTPLLNKGLDFKFGSHTEDFNVLNKVLEDDNQHVPDTRNDTNTSHDCRDVNTAEGKEEVLMQKEEPSRNKKTSSLSPRHDAQLEELVLNCEESPSLSQHTAQLIEGGNINFDVPASNISHAEPTATNSPHEMSDALEESQEIYVEMKHKNNVCDVASITCNTLTDLDCADEDERGSETDNGFEIIDQGDARDHNVTQIIMESRNNNEDGGTSTETVSHQEPCEVSNEKEELHREREYSSTISQIQSGPPQDNAGKMLENKEVREDKGETENTIITDVTSKSEKMLSFEDSATDTGSHAHQQLFMQSPGKEGYDLSEKFENVAFDGSVGRSKETEGIEGMDASLLILEVEKPLTNVNTVYNDSELDLQTENPDQNRVLTEEQNDTSPDINQEAFQVSDNVSAVIDSSPLLHVAVGSEKTDTIAEESDISLVIPEDSQDSYKLTTFHSETQLNEGDAKIVPVGRDTDLEIQTEIKSFYSSTSEAVGTEENSHDVSVLVKEFDVNGDTVTVESNRTTESDFLQTSSKALKVSENPENEVSSDINIIPEDSHREEANTKLSPVVYKRKMGSTRRPLRGDTGQRKRREYDDENETFNSESMINVEKETFSLEYEPSPDKSTSQSSKDGAKEQEMEICEKNDVGPAEGSESDLMQSSFSLDSVSEESTVVTISHITESQTLTNINEETENAGDAERVPAEGDTQTHSEIQTENKTIDLTSEAEGTEENICEATVLVKEVEVIGDTVTVDSDMTTKSDFHQNASSPDAHVEDLKVSENVENKVSGETDTITEPSDINIIPEVSHRVEAHTKSSPVYKRKMGSTRRPLRGDTGQRKRREYDDENETFNSESMINVEKETFSLEYEPSPDKSTSQSSKDGAKEQEMEICEKNDVGPAEGSESDLMQSSFSLDSVSEESTVVTISHITESQTLTNINEETENAGDAERVPAEGDTQTHSEIQTENKTIDLTSEAEGTEENICEATVLVKEVEVIGDTVTVDSDMTTKSDFHQNASSPDAHVEDLKVSENVENKVSGETDTITEPSDINIIPEVSHRVEAHTKLSPVVYKRKMGSTRRPLRGDTGQRKRREYDDENETFNSESMINVEKETFSLEDEPSPDKSTSQSSKDGAKEQEMEIFEKNDVGPAEGPESDLMQSSFSLDLVSEESTVVTLSHITESQTLTKMNQESQEKTGDPERVPAEGDPESHSEIQTENKTTDLTSEAERTEENILDATVLVEEVEFTVDTVTVESNMSEFDLLQNDTFTDAKLEALKVSGNTENASSVTDTGLLVQDDATEGSGELDTIPDRNDTNIIPEDTHREEAHSKPSPIVHKRKMGSTRRPLKGNKGQRKGIKYDESETLEPSPDESMLQSSKDGAKEQEMELCEKNDFGPESDLMQSSFGLDSVSEESTAVTLFHITESQTLTKMNQESQKNSGDPERMPAEGDTESHPEIQTENKTIDLTSEAEGTEENICEATVIVKEVEVIGDTVTVDSDMTTESDFHQNASSPDAHVEDLKVSENVENKVSEETDTITEPSDINIIPEVSHRVEAHTKLSPVVYKRKMGSTRRPLRGDTEQRKRREYDDENETFNSESMINVEKESFSLEDEPSPDKSTSQSSKDGAKEQMEICEKNDVGPAEGSESDLMQSSFSLDLVSEESTAVTLSCITESQTLTKMNQESQEKTGDAERVPAEGDPESHSEIQTENKTTDLTSKAERTEENILDATVLVEEVEFTVDTVTVESNMSEFDLLQNDTFTDAKLEAFKVSEHTENVSSVTDTGLLVQDDVTEGSGETDTIPDRNDTNIIPEDTHREAAHSKPSPIVHKRKMGSTRRPLKGNKGQRKGIKYDENETLDSECTINVEKETFSLEDEPSPVKSTSQSSKDGAKEQEMEICEKNDVGPAEGSESDLMQSSFSLDSVSEESTKVTISHITESQTLTNIYEEYQDNTRDADKAAVGGDSKLCFEMKAQNQSFDSTTCEAEETEENSHDASVSVREDDVIENTVTVESDMTTESVFLQSSPDVNMEALKVSENAEKEVSGETDTILKQSDTNIIPEDTHREETHSKLGPIVHKRKMGSTRRPLKGNKGQRKEKEHYDENEKHHDEREIFVLEDEPSPDESSLQSSKDGAKEQEMEIFEKNDVGPAEGSESDLMQSSFSLDLVSEESTVVTLSHITESQTLTKMNQESQEKTGDPERVPAEGDPESHSEIQTENKTTDLTSEAERTEENILDATVLVEEVEFTVDTVTVESNMSEFDLLQNDTFTDAKLEALKVSENTENVSSVTNTGLLVQDDATEGSGEIDTIPDQNDTIIPEDTHREAAHSKPSPIVHKRKMGSTRRPLKGNKGQRKGIKYDENETLEPSPDESMLQSSKDGAKEQEMELCEKNDFGPESDLMQSSFGLDSVSEESTAVTLSHITESQTLTKMNQESQKNSGDPERMPAEGDTESHPEIQTENKTIDLTSEAEGTEENICEATVIVNKVEVIGDTVTVDSDMTTESDFHQNASSPDAHVEDLNVSENVENKVSGETDTITEPSDINIIPEVSHRGEAHTKLSPVVYKRKMGSTRRPLRGDTGQRKRREYDDENETFSSESMINVEKETFSLEDEPSPDKSTSQSSKDGAKEQMEICEKNDVGPAEGSESDLMQSSFSLDLVSEESTKVTISHITESQTLTKMNQESQEKTGDAERVPAEGVAESHSEIQTENKTTDLTTSEAERTEENILDATVLVGEVEFTVDTVTVESNMSEFDLLQNDTFTDAKLEALKVSENTENASSVTDTGLLVQDDATEGSGELDTIPDRNDTNIIPEDTHREEAHSKPSPIVHKRKMGSTRRPLKGNKGQRKGIKYDENETLEPSPDESMLQSSKDGAKEQEMELCEKNDFGPESDLMQSSFGLDSVSEESTAVTLFHITESQTLTKMNQESQKNSGDPERMPAEGDTESHPEIQTENKTIDLTSEAEGTEENICEATVIVKEVEVIGDTVTVDSDMTTESDFHQNASSPDAHVEDLKVSENVENKVSEETDTITEPSDINIIPEVSHRVEAHTKLSPVVYKRKMGSTRRPLRGDTEQRKRREYDDENETFNSESMINVEKESFSLEDEPSPDKSTSQSSKDGAKEQMEICEKNDVGPAEGSESDLMQSSFSLYSVSEESTAVTLSCITESQTLTKMNQESQEKTGDAERVPAEGDPESHSEIQTENKTTDLTAEETEENSHDASVSVREDDVIENTVTVESDMTTESVFLQSSPDVNMEALKVSENAEKEVSGETDTILKQSDTNIIPEDTHREETHSKLGPIVHKRKMGSTRRPLKGNKGQRKEKEHYDENEKHHDEREIFVLEDEPSPDESSLQSSKDGAKEQEMEIFEKNDVGPAEGSESDLMQSSFSLDLVSEESTAVTLSYITESQTLTKMNQESQDNTGDAERVPAEGDPESHSEIQTENKTTDLTTSEAERTEENILDATVLVGEVEFTVDTVTVESNMSEFDLLQNDTFTDAKLEALKVSENTENVSSVTDTGLLVQDDAIEGSGEIDTIPDRNDTIIPEDTHREAAHSKPSPIVHKRKIGSTRRPLKGNKGQRKGIKYDENETLEPSPDESMLQSSKDGAKEQEMELCEKNDFGPESDLMQSSFGLDSVSEESTAVTLFHITESQTLTKMNQESQKNSGDTERMPAEGDTESHPEIQTENKTIDLTSEAEGTEENICEATVIVKEVEVIGDTVTVDSDMTTESDFHQNASSPDAHVEDLKVSENVENKVSGETDTITEPSDINIIPEVSHRVEAHTKLSPVVYKRKMGSTRRPLRGDTEQRKRREYDDENETFNSESMINVEKESFSLEDEPSPDKSTSQSSKDGAKEQMEICEKNDVGPAEGSESDLMQSSFSLYSVSEESTAVTLSCITESQTLTKMNQESQEKTGDAEKVPAEGDPESHSEIQTENKTTDLTSEAERTEENILDATVLVEEVEFTVDTVTVESNMSEFDLLQNDTFTDAKLEALKVSENTENVSSVTDTGLLVQDDVTEGSGETDTIPDRNDTIIPEDTHREAAHSKPSPIVHKRKMGSTRRPLKGNKGQRKGIKYDENETLDSECTINVEKETFSLEDEPSPVKSTSQSSKDGAKEQEMEICEKNDVGPTEGSESDLMQSSFSLDSVSEESTKVTISHITESQTLTNIYEEYQDNTRDADKAAVGGDSKLCFEMKAQNQSFDSTTSEAEGTEENSHDASVSVREDDVIENTVTVESDMTTESVFLQSSPDVNMEALKVSENAEKEVSGETDTILKQSDTNIIPEDTHREETHSKLGPIVHKRKMGSTRRPLKGNKGQRKEKEHYDENEKHHDEREIFVLEDEPSPDESSLQSSKDGAKEQEMEIFKKNDVGPAEGSESDLMQSLFSLDLVSEESTAVTLSYITESQTLTKMNQESQDNTGDAERVPAEGDPESHSEIQTENKTTDLTTSEAERTEENILDATVLVGEVEFTVDTVTVESNMSEFDLLQNDTFTDANLEALKVSENTENVSSVTDTGLLVQDDATEGSGEIDTIPDRNDTIIPEDTHREAAHSKPSPIVHKRKIGSTRRPLKGNKGQRKGIKYDENKTLDSECTINVEKETFSLEDEPSPVKSTSQSSKDGAKEQEMEICEKNDVGPTEGSESDLMQSSFSLDSVSEESTKVTISHITESQTLTNIYEEYQDNTRDADKAAVGGDSKLCFEMKAQNQSFDSTTSEAEGTEENTCEATVIVKEVEVIGDTVTVDSDMTTESDFHQNASSPDAHVEDLKVSENVENKVSGETDTITEPSDINIIPEVSHRVEAHTKLSPVVYKRKMGSTRRPLRGDTEQRKRREYDDENETFNSESMINVEKESFSLEDEPSPDKSTSQSSKDGAKEQMEICEKNDVGPAEGSESDLMQSSFSLDSVSEESTAVTLSCITESQTLTKMNQESQEKTGDAERVPAEGDPESHSEIQTENKTTDLTSEAERTEENILDATVLVEEVEFTVDTVTVESNMSEFDLLQNDTFTDAKLEALKVSENTENVSYVTDTGLLVQDDVTEGSGETDTIPDRNDTNIIPEDTHREAAHSKPSPIVHKRKMGSTRRPLKGNKGQRKGIKYDENETLDSECTINVEKETFSLEDEPSPVKSTSQSSKDGAKEQEMEICEKNDVGPTEGPESDLMQSSFSLDSVSEESTKVTISHITESQTLTNIYEEYQDNTRDADKAAVGGDSKLCFEMKAQNQSFDSTTCEAEETEENSHDASVSVREDDVIENTVTVESDMTTESVFLQSSPDVNMEALKVSENAEKEVSGETDTILKQSDTNIIPEDTHREETHSKLGPIVHKRKMGSTRRPLKGNKGQRKEKEHYDENEKHHDEREIFVLEDEPSPDESSLQSSKDGAKEQEMEIFEKNDVGPAEGSESDLMQSSFSLDLVSEESTAVTVSYITESQTLTKMNQESQDNTGDAERVPAEGDPESHSEIQTENKTTDLTTSEAERTEENILDATVLVREVEFTVDTVTVESNMSEFDLLQNDTFTDAKLEALKVSENTENVSSVTNTGLLVQDDATEGSGEIDTIPDRNDTIIPEDTHREAAHSKPSPIVHKRKIGSTRRPLKGNKGQRKGIKYDENETLEPSPDESMLQSSKDGAKEQEMELCEKNDFGPESDLMQSSFGLDSVSEESTAVTLSHITESQTLTKMNQESQKNSGDPERMPAEGDTESHPEIQTENKTIDLTSEAEGTEENICEATVIVNKVEVIGDTVTVDSDMTTESDFHQNASSPDAHVEDLKVSENVENKVSGETDIITEPSDINIIPEVSHRVEAHTKLSPVVYKRKMGSTRRPLRGDKGQRKGEEDTETLSEIQDQDNVVGHNVTQEICNIRDDEDEERMTTTLVGMSVQLCDDLKQEHRSDVSQTQTGPSQDDTERTERTASHSDLVLSDALPMEETQIHVSSEDVVMGDTWVPPAEVVEMHSVSNRSLKKRKMGSTRKRGKRMVNEEEVEEEKEGEAENTTIDDGTTKSEETLTLEEAITESLVHQQAFQQSDVQTENSENDQNQAAEIVSDLPLGDVETYSVPEQSEIISIIPEEFHRKDVQSNSIPVVQKRKMGSSRKTLKGNKGQRREVESKKMDGESKGIAKEQDTDTHLAISEGENKWKLDEDVEQNFPVEFSYQAAISNMFSESEDGVKEVSLNIHDPPEVSEEKGLENTVNDSNSLNEAINLYEGTMDKFVLTVSHEDVHQTMSAEYLDQHVHGGSETEQAETMCHVFPTQELKNTQDDVVHENSSQKIPCTKEKRRKMGSTRRNPRVMHGKDMGDQDDILGMAMERETKKAEDDLDDMPLASSISQPKEMSSEAISTTDLESEMSVSATDLKGSENDYQNNSDPSGPTGTEPPENTLQICENQLVSADVTETVTVEKRRKMGSTRKNVREGGIRGKRDAYEDTETADTHLTMSQDSEMSLVGKAVGEQTIHDQSEDSLLSEIERALNKTSQSSSNYELNVNEPNSGDLANTHLNKPENSEIKYLQPQPSQTSKTHSEPNSPERRRRKMGSTRRNPRQQLKAEREDEDKEDGEVEENSAGKKQEMKNLERVEVSVVHNIPENKLNKEYLNVPSAHTSSSQLEESGNPVVQERTSLSTKRKFGSRRTNKSKQGLGRLDASDRSELEDEVNDDLTVCDPHHSLQPENQPISKLISEQSNMEARNEEAAPKGTGAGLVSLDQIIKRDRSTGTKQTINIQNRNSEVQFNVVMVGNSCVGKTSFIRRFHEGQFTEDYRSTIGVDTCMQTVVLPDRTVKLQIWDTAGQERFHSITRQVFHKADGLLLMYEITCSKSFISVRDWISQARERAPDDAIMILLGNKNDSVEREVQIQEGVDLAREYNIHFMECSAATGANVSESMMTLAELLVQRKTRKEEHTTLRREPPTKKSGCC